jgi:hypothetical protein
VSDQLSGSSPSRAKSALDLVSLAGTESRLSLAASRGRLDFLGLDPSSSDHLAAAGRSSRASLGTDLSAGRSAAAAAAIAAPNVRLSLGGSSGGSSLELNNRLRRHQGGGGRAAGRAMPRMGVEGASIYAAAQLSGGGQPAIWRSRSEAGIPGNY